MLLLMFLCENCFILHKIHAFILFPLVDKLLHDQMVSSCIFWSFLLLFECSFFQLVLQVTVIVYSIHKMLIYYQIRPKNELHVSLVLQIQCCQLQIIIVRRHTLLKTSNFGGGSKCGTQVGTRNWKHKNFSGYLTLYKFSVYIYYFCLYHIIPVV